MNAVLTWLLSEFRQLEENSSVGMYRPSAVEKISNR